MHQGASCAVDALLEMYYYSIFKFDKTVLNIESSELINELNSICTVREDLGIASCEMRDGVWNWLVSNLPNAYADKGRHDAEFISGLKEMAEKGGPPFQSLLNGTFFCPTCSTHFEIQDVNDILSLSCPNEHNQGMLGKCALDEFKKRVRFISKSCTHCKRKLQVTEINLSLPKFLLFELGMKDAKNPQNPPFQVGEDILVCGVEYELTGAIVMRPDHFYNIVKTGQQYALIDGYPLLEDLHLYPKIFSSFTGAVKNDETDMSLVHETNPSNAVGVHVVLYHCKEPDHGSISLNQLLLPSPVAEGHETEHVEKACNRELFPDNTMSHDYSNQNSKSTQSPIKIPSPKTKKKISKKRSTSANKRNKLMKDGANIEGTIVLNNQEVRTRNYQNWAFLYCKDIFKALNMTSHIQKRGYTMLDKRLQKLGFSLDQVFLTEGHPNQRKFIRVDAIYGMVSEGKGKSKVSKAAELNVKKDLLSFLNTKFMNPENTEKSETQKNKWRKGRTPKKQRLNVLHGKLKDCLESTYKGEKKPFCDGMSKLIGPKKSENYFFSKEDIVEILKKVPLKRSTKNAQNLLEEIVFENSKCLSVQDLINIEENYSGTRLVEELRKLLPGVIPSQKRESIQKSAYLREFVATLGPQRTPTGWRINPDRLLDLLCFKYYWNVGPKYWKLYGDGREIGGRQSTFIALSILNDDAALHGVSYHDPKEVFPLAIFYEKDSRDNIEENCIPWLQQFLSNKTNEGHTFYLCGDEMFLEAVLDGSGNLGPNSKFGWNIYVDMSSDEKGTTSEVTGLRTDLKLEVNRQHQESLFPCIPTKNVVLCIMHGVARSVEKLLSLEVEDIMSEANKVNEFGAIDRSTYIDNKISALVSNINKRGVKQGNFSITFDKMGKPCPIKLNKDHAVTILSPPPIGLEDMYPHALKNVCPTRILRISLPASVIGKLNLQAQLTVFELVSGIWNHFFAMYNIMRKDPNPILRSPAKEGSLDPVDYIFGYTQQDKKDYKYHAECFYQLYKLRYGSQNLTPYMMKFIDIVPLLMNSLPFSLGRFQNEGGEHANYLHNRFYYHHTTRHGGANRLDPILSLFNNMYKCLSFSINKGDGSECSHKASRAFQMYIEHHVVVSGIPEGIKVKDVEKYLVSKGVQKVVTEQQDGIFQSCSFILCGAIPKMNGTCYSHSSFEELIKGASGRVKDKLPSVGTSTKQYIVLVNPAVSSKKIVPSAVRLAMKAGFPILDFRFVLECLKEGKLLDQNDFRLHFSQFALKYVKHPTLEQKHFRRTNIMTSIIKKRCLKRRRRHAQTKLSNKNPALHFVWSKIKLEREQKSMTDAEKRELMTHFFQQWKMLGKEARDLYRKEYEKTRKTPSQKSKFEVRNPAYMNLMDYSGL
ncbi:hypothetical protein HOLleu_42605 [Holothuria leucospilota]|uniref:BRCT domain-containing protein n=1 Tax=Holothuria leucospilota TaxID=206669 RepID=A0A9Q1BC30_HOLLE|nr:hypothetical protein HOLleu_42605 [Holothuria leucospilota]